METRAQGVGLIGRLAAFVILYAFLVKTVLVLAAPLALPGAFAMGNGAAGLDGMMMCSPSGSSSGASAPSEAQSPDAPAPVHDAGCCLFHCFAQLAIVAPLVLAALALLLRPHIQPWLRRVHVPDARKAVAARFQARGPPLFAC